MRSSFFSEALVGPALIDTPAVRAEIQRRLSDALHGQVSWRALEIGLKLPGKLVPAPETQ